MNNYRELLKNNGIVIIPSFINSNEADLIKKEAQFIFTQQIKLKGIHDGNFSNDSDYEKSEYKKIIDIMNKYNIDLKSLETILKIEKLTARKRSDIIREAMYRFIKAEYPEFIN
jgi:hypothetical protein